MDTKAIKLSTLVDGQVVKETVAGAPSSLVLPTEIHQEIIDYCSATTLATLCRISKGFNKLCTKKLYKNIDLSHPIEDESERCYFRQTRFLQTLEGNKEYAGYVSSLKWTLVFWDASENVDELPFVPTYSDTQPLGLWTIFKALTEVTSVEFSEWEIWGEFSDDVPKDGYMFPNVASISLQGHVNDTFARYILSSTKASQLQHLRLLYFQIAAHMEPTILFVNHLAGKCTSLKSLTIIEDPLDLMYPEDDLGTEISAYIKLLESVRETLETFYLEARISEIPGPRYMPSAQYCFVELKSSLQMVLNHGNWPCLREATFHSVRASWCTN